jgi:hypothetical protein
MSLNQVLTGSIVGTRLPVAHNPVKGVAHGYHSALVRFPGMCSQPAGCLVSYPFDPELNWKTQELYLAFPIAVIIITLVYSSLAWAQRLAGQILVARGVPGDYTIWYMLTGFLVPWLAGAKPGKQAVGTCFRYPGLQLSASHG